MWNPFRKTEWWPDQEWFNLVESMVPHNTPDLAELENSECHPLFVCCDLKTHNHNHSKLKGMKRISWAFTQHPFSMRTMDKGPNSYPIPMLGSERRKKVPYVPIRGELYSVTNAKLVELDEFRKNGVEFERKRVTIIIPFKQIWFKDQRIAENSMVKKHRTADGNLKISPVVGTSKFAFQGVFRLDAFMYVGCADFWSQLFDDGYLFPVTPMFETNTELIKRCYDYDEPPF